MLLPGPEATQLAVYIGWLLHRTRGGIIAGVLFVLPSLLILIGLSWIYLAYGHLPVVAGSSTASSRRWWPSCWPRPGASAAARCATAAVGIAAAPSSPSPCWACPSR
jgi:hypothetical protein